MSTDMVMSIDGAYSVAGRSAGLSSTADHELFLAHRHGADAILVGAATARTERYRRPRPDPEAAQRRTARSQSPTPLLVIVSKSLDLGRDTPLLQGEPPNPILAHPATSDTAMAPEGLELLEAGRSEVDLHALLAELARRGVNRVACEGGPALLGQLARADLIDEYLVTLAPRLAGGQDVGLLGGLSTPTRDYRLHAVLRDGDHMMCSYRRIRA